MAAANTVPTTRLDELSQTINANALKPAQCATLNLTAIVSGNGNLTGTNASELILGGAAGQTIRGGGGDDCIVGGDGNDTIRGEQGTDVCIGGPGTDSFFTCEAPGPYQ